MDLIYGRATDAMGLSAPVESTNQVETLQLRTQYESFLGRGVPLVLELGSSPGKRLPGSLGIDLLPGPGTDIVGDVVEILAEIPDAVVDRVDTSHLLEHVRELDALMHQIGRVLRPGGTCTVAVPHFSNPQYYSDPTHVRPFGLYTMSYFATTSLFRRAVPQYSRVPGLELVDVGLVFVADRRHLVHVALTKLAAPVVNRTRRMQEAYERFPWLLPCAEIRYELRKLPLPEG